VDVFAVEEVDVFAVADLEVVVGAGAVVLLVVAGAVGDFVPSELSAEPEGDVSCDLLGVADGGALEAGGVVVGFGSVLGELGGVDGELGGVEGLLGEVDGLLGDVDGLLGEVDGLPGVVGFVGGLLVGRGVGLVVGVWLLGVSGSGEPRCGPSTVPSTEP
jgi:hypothetical protein